MHSTRLLFYSSSSSSSSKHVAHVYNVDTRQTTRLSVGRAVESFVCVTGIDIGPQILFNEYETHKTFIYSPQSGVITPFPVLQGEGRSLDSLVPSESDPSNMSKALCILSDGSLWMNGEEKELGDVGNLGLFLAPGVRPCLVRVWKDFFFLWSPRERFFSLVQVSIE